MSAGADLKLVPDPQRSVPDPKSGPAEGGPLPLRVDLHFPELDGREVLGCAVKVEKRQVRRFGKDSPERLFVTFKLIEPGYDGEQLWMSLQVRDRPTPASKFYRAWTIANEGRPRRGERLVFKRFVSSVFRVRCRSVTRNSRQRLLTEDERYTVVDEIVALEARGRESR